MKYKRFPGFGAELERGFPVHENCYDCVEFYNGCDAWPENRAFQCGDYYPLPSVMPGTLGQVFPPSRMQGRKEPRVRREPTATNGVRICECGAALLKNKKLCDQCRTQRRRQTKRQYMCTYMNHRRSAVVDADSNVPPSHTTRPPRGPQIEDVSTSPPTGRGLTSVSKICTNKIHLGGDQI